MYGVTVVKMLVYVCDCSAENICDASEKKLVFEVKSGTDQSIFWRTTVRIRCCKVSAYFDSYAGSKHM